MFIDLQLICVHFLSINEIMLQVETIFISKIVPITHEFMDTFCHKFVQ